MNTNYLISNKNWPVVTMLIFLFVFCLYIFIYYDHFYFFPLLFYIGCVGSGEFM